MTRTVIHDDREEWCLLITFIRQVPRRDEGDVIHLRMDRYNDVWIVRTDRLTDLFFARYSRVNAGPIMLMELLVR